MRRSTIPLVLSCYFLSVWFFTEALFVNFTNLWGTIMVILSMVAFTSVVVLLCSNTRLIKAKQNLAETIEKDIPVKNIDLIIEEEKREKAMYDRQIESFNRQIITHRHIGPSQSTITGRRPAMMVMDEFEEMKTSPLAEKPSIGSKVRIPKGEKGKEYPHLSPPMFLIGQTYRQIDKTVVLILGVSNQNTEYETVYSIDPDGNTIHRYNRRDFGRVTGSAMEVSDPRNLEQV